MNKDKREYLRKILEWYESIEDRSDEGLRKALEGEPTWELKKPFSQVMGVIYANITHTFDIEVIRYRLRVEFAKSAKFNHKAFKKISEKFEVSLDEAKAMYFADLNALCHQFSEEGVNFLNRHSIAILEKAFNEIHKDGLTEAVRRLRVSPKTKKEWKGVLEYETIPELMKDAYLFVGAPRVGRPKYLNNKTKKIVDGIFELFESEAELASKIEISRILTGDSAIPKVTRTLLSKHLQISRPTLNDWLVRSDVTFDECTDLAEQKFLKSLRKHNLVQKS